MSYACFPNVALAKTPAGPGGRGRSPAADAVQTVCNGIALEPTQLSLAINP